MQRPDEKKRQLITATAARLFATRPFHKVRLDDIAAAARIGKGTLYIYFDSKEDLYFSLIYDGFARLVDRLRTCPSDEEARCPVLRLRAVVRELVSFAFQHPHLFEMIRAIGMVKGRVEADWARKRTELQELIHDIIRAGVEAGYMNDPHPELTALCVPGLVRSVMLFGPVEKDPQTVADHILHLLERGIVGGAKVTGDE